MINSEIIQAVLSKSKNLPKDFRIMQFNGIKIFENYNLGYQLEILNCPDEISDSDLQRSDVIKSKVVTIKYEELGSLQPNDLMNLIRNKILDAIKELKES